MMIGRDRARRDRRREEVAERGQRAGGRGVVVAAEVSIGRRERGQVDTREQRLVAGPVVQRRARDRCRAQRPAVETALEGDDPGPARDATGELEGRLDRLRAGVEEEHRVERLRHRRGDLLGETGDGLGEAHGPGRPDESVDLGVDRGRHGRVVVAEHGDRDAVREVEIGLAIGVVQPVALAVTPLALEVATEDRRDVPPTDVGDRMRGSASFHQVLGFGSLVGHAAGPPERPSVRPRIPNAVVGRSAHRAMPLGRDLHA